MVVDNASTDGSIENLDRFSLPLKVIRNNKNLGFAAACNQGAAVSGGDYLLFLNPDTELFKNSLSVPLAFMEHEDNKNVGLCGIQLVDKDGKVSRTCARFPSLSRFIVQAIGLNKLPGMKGTGVHMREWDHSSTKSIEHVIGAFFFMHREVFDSLEGFDERFFVYLEDVDFSYRARQVGWKIMYLAGAQAYHAGGGTSRQVKARRLFYSLRSRLLYGFKHFSNWQAWLLAGITLLVEPATRIFFCSARGEWHGVKDTIRGYHMLWRDLVIIKKGSENKRNK